MTLAGVAAAIDHAVLTKPFTPTAAKISLGTLAASLVAAVTPIVHANPVLTAIATAVAAVSGAHLAAARSVLPSVDANAAPVIQPSSTPLTKAVTIPAAVSAAPPIGGLTLNLIEPSQNAGAAAVITDGKALATTGYSAISAAIAALFGGVEAELPQLTNDALDFVDDTLENLAPAPIRGIVSGVLQTAEAGVKKALPGLDAVAVAHLNTLEANIGVAVNKLGTLGGATPAKAVTEPVAQAESPTGT